MTKDFIDLPIAWEDARGPLSDMLRELTREMSLDNFEGKLFTQDFTATVGVVLNHELGKAPTKLIVENQTGHGSFVMTVKTITQVTVTCDGTLTATFRIA